MAAASDGIERETVLDSVTSRIKIISVHFVLNNNSLEFLPVSAEYSEENVWQQTALPEKIIKTIIHVLKLQFHLSVR